VSRNMGNTVGYPRSPRAARGLARRGEYGPPVSGHTGDSRGPAARGAGAPQAARRRARTAYGLRFPLTVRPTAMITHQGIRYAMPAGGLWAPGHAVALPLSLLAR